VVADGVFDLHVPQVKDWGPSVSVNNVRGPLNGAAGRKRLEIEMQSGDVIVIEAAAFDFPQTNYEASDLHLGIDDVSLIRRSFGPEMSGQQLASQLARDLILTGSLPFSVDCVDEWWVVSSKKDWLLMQSESITLRSFKHIVHFPEAGREACHSEILLSAFANAVVTRVADEELIWIVGDDERQVLPRDVLKHLMKEACGRTVAFTLKRVR